MVRWKIPSWSLAVLGCVLFVMLLLVVLPDVDPPDTAFHRDTSPVAVHALASAVPAVVAVAPTLRLAHVEALSHFHEQWFSTVSAAPNFRPILFRSLRC